MKYEHLDSLADLVERKLVTRRKHPTLPLFIYNYTIAAQFTPIAEWSLAMCDCRGLILDDNGHVVGRPFRKFWNYEQVFDRIPIGENFTVWEKVDGSLGIVCEYEGHPVVSTRGSFESDQARWADQYIQDWRPHVPGLTYLFEIVYPKNRIVVDYGDTEAMFLLAVLDEHGADRDDVFMGVEGFRKARRFDGISDYESIELLGDCPEYAGGEGFVLRWDSGFRAKVKFAEYKRLHKLVTQCSTRTIWELLRTGKDTTELLDRVPDDFKAWARGQISGFNRQFESISLEAMSAFNATPGKFPTRKDFAMWAKSEPNPSLLFALLDGKSIEDATWKLIEPKWATPFKSEVE